MIYLKYLWYVIRHKWYVFIDCAKWGLYWRGIMHDMSKFRPDEFIPYARYFYGDYGVNNKCPAKWSNPGDVFHKVKNDFDKAWLLHLHRNPHHWQYWVLQNDTDGTYPLEIPSVYVDEMICDWRGAGMAINGKDNTAEWYTKNRDNMIFHPDTQREIEIVIGVPGTSTTITFNNPVLNKEGL